VKVLKVERRDSPAVLSWLSTLHLSTFNCIRMSPRGCCPSTKLESAVVSRRCAGAGRLHRAGGPNGLGQIHGRSPANALASRPARRESEVVVLQPAARLAARMLAKRVAGKGGPRNLGEGVGLSNPPRVARVSDRQRASASSDGGDFASVKCPSMRS